MKTKKSQRNTVSRVQRAQRVNRPRQHIVHTDSGYVHSAKYGCRVKQQYLPDGTPAASNCGGSARRESAKFLALVKSMALGFPKQIGEPILDGLSRLTPKAIGAIRNLERAAELLTASDPDFRAVRVMFSNMLTGTSRKSLTVDARQAVIDAVNASGTKSATGSVSIPDAKEDNERDPIEIAELGGIISASALFGAKLGPDVLSSDAGAKALVNFTSGVVGGLIDEGCAKTQDDVQGWVQFISSVAIFGAKLGVENLATDEDQQALSKFAAEALRLLAEDEPEAA